MNFDRLVNIAGFICGLAAGVVALILGIAGVSDTYRITLIVGGVWMLVAVALAWFAGASAEPSENPFNMKVGAKFKYVPDWAWWIIALGLVAVIIVAIVEGVVQ